MITAAITFAPNAGKTASSIAAATRSDFGMLHLIQRQHYSTYARCRQQIQANHDDGAKRQR